MTKEAAFAFVKKRVSEAAADGRLKIVGKRDGFRIYEVAG